MRISLTLVFLIFVMNSFGAKAQFLTPGDADQAEATSGNPSVAPFKWAGLLIIPNPTPKDPNAGNLCTGQFIAPSVVLTAGHCLRDLPSNPLGPWPDATKGIFWLQYQNQAGMPFKIVCGEVNPLWSMPQNYASLSASDQNGALNKAFEHDFAMLLVDGKSPTGTMPYALDWKGQYSRASRIGYPGDILEGTVIQKAPGIVFPADALPFGAASSPNLVVQWGPVTDATQGMSGGAWVAHPDPGEGQGHNVLLAVTSFNQVMRSGRPRYPGGTFAAYLTAAEFNPLLASVENGCK
ncbi:MAG: hypothetical protein AB1508_00065 [Pseudomonadota bacterium]